MRRRGVAAAGACRASSIGASRTARVGRSLRLAGVAAALWGGPLHAQQPAAGIAGVAPASTAAPSDPRALALVDRAITRMGGEAALRGIRTIRMDVLTQWQRTAYSAHPYADQPSFERHADLRDYATHAWRNTRDFLPGGRVVDIVRDTVGARTAPTQGGALSTMPLNVAYVTERRELFAFAPERTLLLARDAGGLRLLSDSSIAGVAHARIAGAIDGFPATWFLRRTDGLPAMVRFRADETDDFGLAPWGEMEVETWWSNWVQLPPGVLLPRQRDVRRVGRPYKRMTALAITVHAAAPADSFSLSDDVVQRFLATERRPMWAVSLDSTQVTDSAFVTFPVFLGSMGAVRVGGVWVVLETAQAEGAMQLAHDWLERHTGRGAGVGVAARAASGNGGARWFAARRRPLLVAPGAAAHVRSIVPARELAAATVVSTARWVRAGTDSLWLEPIDLPDAAGTLAVYSPAHRWVYSPLFGFPAYRVEHDALVRRLRARGLAVEWMGWGRAIRAPLPAS